MSEDFCDIGALSGAALAALARALLTELEGANAPSRMDARPDEGASDTARLAEAIETLFARIAPAFPAEEAALQNAAPSEKPAEAELTRRAEPERGDAPVVRTATSREVDAAREYGNLKRFSFEAGAETPDIDKLSERIRRDSRRCDSGFERY